MSATPVPETFAFQAEINQLMSLIVNAFYSNRDVFLRELISNASDAIDKARYEKLQAGNMTTTDLAIRIVADKANKTLTIADDGIGMSRDDLISNLGTIARSGTKAFMEALSAKQADMSLIGQFGVGFYSAYLVAERVCVTSRADAGAPLFQWESMAGGTFTMQEIANDTATANATATGTSITLFLRDDSLEYLEENKIRELVTKHNSYISHPISLQVEREVEVEVEAEQEVDEKTAEGEEAVTNEVAKKEMRMEWDQLNKQKPIWLKSPDDVTQDEHDAFYKNLSSDWEAPLAHKFIKAEGNLEFKGILYAPRRAPFDMFQTTGKRRNIKLYVRRVFITDDCEELVPEWLNFVKGVIDSDDLPLNISREMLQQNRVMKVIKKNIMKKAIDMFQDLAENKPEDYATFYEAFSKNLKLGVYDSTETSSNTAQKDALIDLLRFYSSNDAEKPTSLLDYTTRAKPDQTKIYFITGDNLDAMRKSPFIERLIVKGYEVLFMKDAIDEYLSQRLTEYTAKDATAEPKTFKFVNVSKDGALFDEEEQEKAAEFEALCTYIKDELNTRVEKVQVSARLAKAPAAIVTGAYGWTANMERIMKAQALQSNNDMHSYMKPKKILEINPDHAIVKALKAKLEDDNKKPLNDLIHMLFDTTLLASGFSLEDSNVFVDRIHRLMASGMALDDEPAEDEPPTPSSEPTPPLTAMEQLD